MASFREKPNVNADPRHKLSKSYSSPANTQNVFVAALKPQRPPLIRSLTRTESIKQNITNGTANFFGIPGSNKSDHQYQMQKWANRRMKHCSRRYGQIKEAPNEIPTDAIDGFISTPQTPIIHPERKFGDSAESGISTVGRSLSISSRSAIRRNTLSRRDSVAKMAWEGLSSLVKSPARKRQPGFFRKDRPSRSFSPNVIVGAIGASEDSVFGNDTTPRSSAPVSPQTEFAPFSPSAPCIMTAIPEQFDEGTDGGIPMHEMTIEPRKSSMKGVKPHLKLKRMPTLIVDAIPEASPLQDDVFFDITPVSSTVQQLGDELPTSAFNQAAYQPSTDIRFALHYPPVHPFPVVTSPGPESSTAIRTREARREFFGINEIDSERDASRQRFKFNIQPPSEQRFSPSTVHRKKPAVAKERLTLNNIWSRVVDSALNNNDRRIFGEGVVGRFFGRTLKKKSELSPTLQEKLDDFDDYRPFFTYWVTIVQILVLIISLAIYGFGPFGFSRSQYTAMVLQTSLVLEQVAYLEQENFWLGPRFADLVHLGAKYAPCMRRDRNVLSTIDAIKEAENNSACCIRNDRTGCVQASFDRCPSLLAVWHKWDGTNNPERRMSGSVCNQDPRECHKPTSSGAFKWPDDITKWPVCTEVSTMPKEPHMECEITGRPCCYGIIGECGITTREYCDFVKGYFHEEATLCSQVSCLGEVCGMIPFVNAEYPNQFYRLFISLFLHAGLLHIIFTILIQFILMRDLEKLIGWFRLAIIYLGSGVGGNLASAVFIPYEVVVGPAGSHFGLLAALFVDAIYSWQYIDNPWKALLQLGAVLSFLLTIGLLPWIDNWAHTFGFIFGLLLSLALFPFIQINENDRFKRIFIVIASLFGTILLFALLLILFYVHPLWECESCVYFNCIPFTEHFCDNKGLELTAVPYF